VDITRVMDYWDWMTAIMVVLVLANLIRMNMWLVDIGNKVDYLYDGVVEEHRLQEHILNKIKLHLTQPDNDNSEEVKEWDQS
jgi:hypothetical protein